MVTDRRYKNHLMRLKPIAAALLLAALIPCSHAEVKLASPFTDHMVLQRDAKVPIWGTADAGETVTVEFVGQIKSATADANGKWLVKLDPLPASAEPRQLLVRGNRQSKI